MDVVKFCLEVSKRFLKSTWSLTYETVADSGFFYEKYELERTGQEVNFEEETAQRLSELAGTNKTTIIVNRHSIRTRYLEKYKQWKSLFHVAN
jgi:hypothetical protein